MQGDGAADRPLDVVVAVDADAVDAALDPRERAGATDSKTMRP